jgi:hypothetical protein
MVLGHARFGQIVLEQTTLINKCTHLRFQPICDKKESANPRFGEGFSADC